MPQFSQPLDGILLLRTPIIFDSKDVSVFRETVNLCYQITQDLVKSGEIAITPYCRDLNPSWFYEIFRADFIYDRCQKTGQVIEINFGDPSGAGVMEGIYNRFFSNPEQKTLQSLKRDQTAEAILKSLLRFAKQMGLTNSSKKARIFLGMPKHASVYYDFELLRDVWASKFDVLLGDPKDLKWSAVSRKFKIYDKEVDVLYRDEYFDWCIDNSSLLLPQIEACLRDTGIFPGLSPLESRFLDSKKFLPLYAEKAKLQGSNLFAPTKCLNSFSNDEILEAQKNREHWVLKRNFGYGGKNVHIGSMIQQFEWNALLERLYANESDSYVMQEYHRLPIETFQPMDLEKQRAEPLSVLLSLWSIGGSFSGCIIRASHSPVVNVHQNCGFAPALYDI